MANPQQQPEEASIPGVNLDNFRPSTFNYMIREEGSPEAQRGLGHLRRAPAEVEGGEEGPELFQKYQLEYTDGRTGRTVKETWRDGEPKYTIGFGHVIERVRDENGNLVQDTQYDDGIDITAAGNLMVGDMGEKRNQARDHYNRTQGAGLYQHLPQDLQDLMMDMRYQAGRSPKMVQEIGRGNLERAMVESWIGQTPGRSQRRREQFFPALSQDYTELGDELPIRNVGVPWSKWNKTPTTDRSGLPFPGGSLDHEGRWNESAQGRYTRLGNRGMWDKTGPNIPGHPDNIRDAIHKDFTPTLPRDDPRRGIHPDRPTLDPAWHADSSGPEQIRPWPGGTPRGLR